MSILEPTQLVREFIVDAIPEAEDARGRYKEGKFEIAEVLDMVFYKAHNIPDTLDVYLMFEKHPYNNIRDLGALDLLEATIEYAKGGLWMKTITVESKDDGMFWFISKDFHVLDSRAYVKQTRGKELITEQDDFIRFMHGGVNADIIALDQFCRRTRVQAHIIDRYAGKSEKEPTQWITANPHHAQLEKNCNMSVKPTIKEMI